MNGQQDWASTPALGTATEKLISGTPPRPAQIFLVGDQKSSCLESVPIHVETLLTRMEDFETLCSSHVTGSSVTISQESRKPMRRQHVTKTAGLPWTRSPCLWCPCGMACRSGTSRCGSLYRSFWCCRERPPSATPPGSREWESQRISADLGAKSQGGNLAWQAARHSG